MTPFEVYTLARNHGRLSHETAVIATAVSWPESGLNPGAVGDENLEDKVWGPSVGLWQIRSLRADFGTGRARDAQRLKDPEFNAHSMGVISKGGTDFTPWTDYRSGKYKKYLQQVRDSINPTKEESMKFVTRSEWGADDASVADLWADTVTVHWAGTPSGNPSHAQCAGVVRSFQRYHMNTHGWSDIAYNLVVCAHGYVFEGRGKGKRSAANGDYSSNSASYAICYLLGDGEPFTDEAKDAINDASEYLVPGPREWAVHQDWVGTGCPGNKITSWVRSGHPRASAVTRPDTTKEDDQLFSNSDIENTVHIVAMHSQLLLTSTDDVHGSAVVQHPADGSLNQRWKVIGHEDGTVSFVNRAGDLALDRPDYNTDAGTILQVGRTEYNDAQRWTEDRQGKVRRIWAPGTNRCVDVAGNSASPGDVALLWYGKAEDFDNQFFMFIPTV